MSAPRRVDCHGARRAGHRAGVSPNSSLALSTPSGTAEAAVPLDPVAEASLDPRLDPIPGHRGMWVAICLEFVEFAVFFIVQFSARWHHPLEFQAGARNLWTTGGVLITLAMVSRGWLLTRALRSIGQDRRRTALRWMAAARVVASPRRQASLAQRFQANGARRGFGACPAAAAEGAEIVAASARCRLAAGGRAGAGFANRAS